MATARLTGCGTALVTPFLDNGDVDEAALRGLVDWQIAEGIDCLVPCGSTGEAVTLSAAEHRRVVQITAEQVAGRIPVIAGAGSNDTRKAIATSLEMKAVGATHLLHVTPMYNKPPQRALVAHFKAIADACDLPIVLYNVPGRTSINLEAQTTLELAEDARFIAVKEASANLTQISEIIRHRPSNFSVLSGDDSWTLPLMALGADGIISVVSNNVPRAMTELTAACAAGDFARARDLDRKLAPWMNTAFVESNPIPAKAGLAMMGRIRDNLRLPLVRLAERHHAAVRSALEHANAL
ncbi:MAG: 4-hydroxy-tetrahydrodipicolinate synthase [Phycisphaerae bacterium]|nr:4-hydroxy-tetrahydrodipicolinate synthase [Gemmatimonadaceae bacterium]